MAPYKIPYHVYHDLDVINSDFSGSSAPHLRFEETRNAPFLDGDNSEYFVSIIRFSNQTANSLPVFIPQIENPSVDINKTISKMTFVYTQTGVNYTTTSNLPVDPTVPYKSGPLPYNYYLIYDYIEIMKMLNATFNALMTTGSIGSAVNADTSNSFAPFTEIDPKHS